MGKVSGRNASISVKEIENHKKESGKNGTTIEKTSERGLQFKNERYLNADTIQTMIAKDLLKFKGVCHASMKKGKRFVDLHLCRKSFNVYLVIALVLLEIVVIATISWPSFMK